ncbi:T9SS type A sorting domain-containing protein [Portibacter lacus]|uniref:Secretion system C-terminal sorting domain-containing protein n=1 Tax=Portibacter lacus TaxID=1099794 RepID=A0AA37SJT2_9BACT|nr:T9SS type A sorting domain-containing protein [Portibacter lacus]GLR15841.1 hypothetical protein GCM10007940_04560 [Portibacter lacus]
MTKQLLLTLFSTLFLFTTQVLASENYVGGIISLMDGSTATRTCVGDGIADPIMVMLMDAEGPKSTFVVTDTAGIILAIQTSNTFDFEGAGAGTCLIWHMGYKDIVGAFKVGMNKDDVQGWLDFSNAITITREPIAASSISSDDRTTIEICIDGIPDPFTVQYTQGIGKYHKWIITDEDLNILALTNSNTFDLEGAGVGTCLIWRLNYNQIFGNIVGLNAADLGGCFMLSNPITVVRQKAESSEIALADGSTEMSICAGDGVSDEFTPVLTGGEGEFNQWVITDSDKNILGLPDGPTFDLEGAGPGVCLLWNLNYNGQLPSLTAGSNLEDVIGCAALSNAITINRNGVSGGVVSLESGGTELSICAGDGIPDPFTVLVEGVEGSQKKWVITDTDLNILGLPEGPTFDLEGAGAGTCLVWCLSYNGTITGAEVGMNVGDIEGCYGVSNAITVTRSGVQASTIELVSGGVELSICAGDGNLDLFTVNSENGEGENRDWVITDTDQNILALPNGPTFNLEEAGSGVCLLWEVNYNGVLSGLTVGENVGNFEGCFVLSNPITVTRNGVSASAIAIQGGATEIDICAGDGISDAFNTTLEKGEGENGIWVITDSDLNILAFPESSTFDLEGAGGGTCLIWYVSYNGDLEGAEVGGSANDITGCFALSNAITVNRSGVEASAIALEDGEIEFSICAGDGVADPFTVTSSEGIGESSAWVITDSDLNILGLPEGPTFDLEGAGSGVCLLWQVNYNGTLTGAVVGENAGDLSGCFVLSNPITVTRNGVSASAIAIEGGATEIDICAGDGISDAFNTTLEKGEGENGIWVITDDALNILAFPESSTFDLEGAGGGTCLIWYVSYNGDLEGAEVGGSANDITGCFALSNAITVNRSGVEASAIAIEGGGTEIAICAGDGISDLFTAEVSGGVGEFSAWVITDADLNILALPEGPGFDLDGAGEGTCLLWNVNYNGTIRGLEVGANAADLSGCFVLSNQITVERSGVEGVEIAIEGGGTVMDICAGDGISDEFAVNVVGTPGMDFQWIITDSELNILGLPDGPTFDLEGAGEGQCLLWYLSYNGTIEGLEVGMNAADLIGCSALSNSITINRSGIEASTIATVAGSTAFTICAGDGISDLITAVVNGGLGDSSGWVITDTSGLILGLPEGPSFDLEDAGAGICQIWNYHYNDELDGLVMGGNVKDLIGCVAFSNPITITRDGVEGASISLDGNITEMDICVGDGNADMIMPLVSGGIGSKTAWIITDADTNIIALPFAPPFDLEGAGEGTCLIWQLSYNGSIFGIDLDEKAYNIDGCTALSNPIIINRKAVDGGILTLENGENEITICAGDGQSDAFNVSIDSIAGDSSGWIITDQDLNILGLPAAPPFDLEGAGVGVCLIWHVSYNGEISGAVVDSNAMNIAGCYSLSNPITVTRVDNGDLCTSGLLTENDVDIFPNPSRSIINVTLKKHLSDDLQADIFDAYGRKVVANRNMTDDGMEVNIESLDVGVYYLKIIANKESVIKEFIKI